MARLRISITKGEALRFLGHLDFLRSMERALRRSGLPLAYSEGFNPHMKVNYDSALGVGVTAEPFYADLELEEELPWDDIVAALSPQLPQGIMLTAGRYIDPKTPKLMAYINYETYSLTGPAASSYTPGELAAALAEFNARGTIPYRKVTPKKTRDLDVRAIVPEPVAGTVENGDVTLCFGLLRTLAGSIKPGELWEILAREHGLCVTAGEFIATRTGAFYRDEAGALHTPLDGAVS